MEQKRYPRWWGAVAPAVLLAVWTLCGAAGMLPRYLSQPADIWREFASMISSRELFGHVSATVYRALAGYGIGAFSGIVVGLLAGSFRPIERFYEPIISLTYPVPKIAALPIIFAWFGAGDLSKIVIIFVSVFYPVYIAAIAGAKSTSKIHLWAARNMGASRWRIIFHVILPNALPQIFNGLRIGLALSFVLVFVAELVSSQKGLGYLIVFAEQNDRFDMMYVAIITIGVIGFLADRLVLAVRDRLLVGQMIGREGRR